MEFFRFINIRNSLRPIEEVTTLDNLSALSNELFVIGDQNEINADIGGIWGEFTLNRMEIKGGVRFALLECPNALAWTITTGLPPNPDMVVIHLTINRQDQSNEFLEEIQEFLDDHTDCLGQILTVEPLDR